jgi:hypothetical protein
VEENDDKQARRAVVGAPGWVSGGIAGRGAMNIGRHRAGAVAFDEIVILSAMGCDPGATRHYQWRRLVLPVTLSPGGN